MFHIFKSECFCGILPQFKKKPNIIVFFININRVSPQRDRVKVTDILHYFLNSPSRTLRGTKPTQHWHFPVIPCWLSGIIKQHRERWIKCQLWLCGGTVSISDDVCAAVGPVSPHQPPLRWHELRSTLSHQQRTSSWINESFRSKWTLHTGENKSFYAIDCGAQLNNLFIQLACPCPISSTLNYILEVKL